MVYFYRQNGLFRDSPTKSAKGHFQADPYVHHDSISDKHSCKSSSHARLPVGRSCCESQPKQNHPPDLEDVQGRREHVKNFVALGIHEETKICWHWISGYVNRRWIGAA